jgi:hypothetical protein
LGGTATYREDSAPKVRGPRTGFRTICASIFTQVLTHPPVCCSRYDRRAHRTPIHREEGPRAAVDCLGLGYRTLMGRAMRCSCPGFAWGARQWGGRPVRESGALCPEFFLTLAGRSCSLGAGLALIGLRSLCHPGIRGVPEDPSPDEPALPIAPRTACDSACRSSDQSRASESPLARRRDPRACARR